MRLCQKCRKRVSVYTNAPFLLPLGVRVDPRIRRERDHVRSIACARERLCTIKRTLNVQMVKRYKDRSGAWRVALSQDYICSASTNAL